MMTGGCGKATFPLGRLTAGVIGSAGVVVLLAALLSGCDGFLSDPKTPEEVVAERAQARWEALIAGQWESAYSFASPAYRSMVDVDGFRRRQGGKTLALGSTVRKVECDGEACEAVVRLKFRPPVPQIKSVLETDYKERWVLDDGDWWIFLTP